MEIEILSRRENKLLSRMEVRFQVRYEEGTTPSRPEMREGLTKELKLNKQVLVVDSVHSQFGKREARGYAKIYESVEDARRLERPHVLARNGLAEAPA
ncbi:MAG: 30S ribosomal protein S24e [Candidatus Thermoplasmatota archaeon]|nr:30S ribosomal protein S24e [Candidatus Thermoplasmatota archaeon]